MNTQRTTVMTPIDGVEAVECSGVFKRSLGYQSRILPVFKSAYDGRHQAMPIVGSAAGHVMANTVLRSTNSLRNTVMILTTVEDIAACNGCWKLRILHPVGQVQKILTHKHIFLFENFQVICVYVSIIGLTEMTQINARELVKIFVQWRTGGHRCIMMILTDVQAVAKCDGGFSHTKCYMHPKVVGWIRKSKPNI